MTLVKHLYLDDKKCPDKHSKTSLGILFPTHHNEEAHKADQAELTSEAQPLFISPLFLN